MFTIFRTGPQLQRRSDPHLQWRSAGQLHTPNIKTLFLSMFFLFMFCFLSFRTQFPPNIA